MPDEPATNQPPVNPSQPTYQPPAQPNAGQPPVGAPTQPQMGAPASAAPNPAAGQSAAPAPGAQPVQLDNNFLTAVGLGGMPDQDKQAFLQHLYEELELRVGTELSKNLSDQQLQDFEKLIEAKDQQGAMQWLETNCPNYKDVVRLEIEKLRQEIVQNRDAILGDSAPQNPPLAA